MKPRDVHTAILQVLFELVIIRQWSGLAGIVVMDSRVTDNRVKRQRPSVYDLNGAASE